MAGASWQTVNAISDDCLAGRRSLSQALEALGEFAETKRRIVREAMALRTTVITANLPTKITVTGNPQTSGARDAYVIRPVVHEDLWWFAGLLKAHEGLEAISIVTTETVPGLQELHSRWPLILPGEACVLWLDPATPREELFALMQPCPENLVDAYEVGLAVGNVRNEGPELIRPVA
jgi:hypothetical protein